MSLFRYLRVIGVLALLTAVLTSCAVADAARRIVPLNSGWKFIRQDTMNAQAPAFDDSRWEAVALPHTWNALDGEDGGSNYYRGGAWYRRHLTLPVDLAGRSLFLQFDGAATVTTVYVNGRLAGEHRGNFAAFCFDVTSMLKSGEDNVIAVRVDNSANPDIAPRSGDFTIFGGLYRDVRLLALSPLSVTPMDYGSPGIFLTPTAVSAQSAEVEAKAELRNADPRAKSAAVEYAVADANGHVVASGHTTQDVPAAGSADATVRLTVPAPHLWDGVRDPYLYQVTVTVRDGRTIVDRVTQPLGLRTFHVDPNEGFFLNGTHYDLLGVNRHQDRIDKGWAIGPAEHQEDYALIRAMGSTGIRLSHYQHAQTFYDLCDHGGIVVWAELSLVNSLGNTQAFDDNAKQQLTELIKQNYNHPSICFWGLYNEINFPHGDKVPAEWALIGTLNSLAHQLDPHRLTTAATNNLPFEHPVNFITDIIGVNRYFGWYLGSPSQWAAELDALHQKYPARCIGLSEYGGGASVFQHADNPPQPQPYARWHPEEWQATLHEAIWDAAKSRPFLWSKFIWCMFDFASDGRGEGDTLGRNDKGMVTYDRKTKKDAYYLYQSQWTKAPMVYITDRRFTPRPLSPVTVKVYSNCGSVDLRVNGQSLGSKTSTNGRFIWTDVILTPGDNHVEAVGTAGGKSVKDFCVWTYAPKPQSPQ